MKVIFLDFDGVLNSQEWQRRKPRGQGAVMGLDPAAVGLLNQLVLRTGAVVVISSTWRLFPEQQAEKSLAAAGFIGQVIGKTPDGALMHGAIYGAVVRGHELQRWLDLNKDREIESFVILDDDQDMAHLAGRLVATSFGSGLTQRHVDEAVVMLGGDGPRLIAPTEEE